MSLNDILAAPLEDQMLLRLAKLMQGGEEDEETCKTLDAVTKLLHEDDAKAQNPLHVLIDEEGFNTILEYLDMRQGDMIRGHATLTVSAYLKVSDQVGAVRLSSFFRSHVSKGTYDDFIIAFSVAASIFPVVPSVSADLFLSNGFVGSLGSLMKRKWKSKKVERACLEMLNAACMDAACREAIQKYCADWLEEIVAQYPDDAVDIESSGRYLVAEDGSRMDTKHARNVRDVAAVVLAKLQAIPSNKPPSGEKIQPAVTSMDELSVIFTRMLGDTSDSSKHISVEGLAYASLRPEVKEKLINDDKFLKNLIKVLADSPAKSPTTYGSLSILVNLTSYLPAQSEEQKRMQQLKAYANAQKSSVEINPLNDDAHVARRCQKVFEGGTIPILVTHSLRGSAASLNLVVSITHSLAKTPKLRGQMAQQGAIRLLLHAYSTYPDSSTQPRRLAAHALALILISTNPAHIFGGTNPLSLTSAIRPLLTLLHEDPTSSASSLLPTFESLLALTNLASTDDNARIPIIRSAFPAIDDLLLNNNPLIVRATVELLCNLMLSPQCVEKFGDGTKVASNRTHILLALADAEDEKTRMAAGGALASLTEWDTAVNAVLERERGIRILLGLCKEDDEGLRHRGVVCILNVMSIPGKVGEWGLKKVSDDGGLEILKECLKRSRSQDVLEITVEALKKLLGAAGRGGTSQKTLEG